MEVSFSQLCHDGQFCAALRPHVDAAARQGQSYELPRCRLPQGCEPAVVCLGIFRRSSGTYVLYWQPRVEYRGTRRVLALFFRQGLWTFDSYEQLAARLHSLRSETSAAEEPAAPSPPVLIRARPGRVSLRRGTDSPWPPMVEALRQALGERVLGQRAAVEACAYYLYGFLGKVAPARPLSLVLHGPSGVGKSELAKAVAAVAERQSGERWQFVWTELNTFTQPHSVHRLTGAPPGYVGYEDEPILSAVKKNPRTVFMFDELDKAHGDVWKIFMSILDEGRCSVSRAGREEGRELDYRKCIFLFTTNLALASAPPALGFCGGVTRTLQQNAAAATPEELAQRLFDENELGRAALVRHGVLQEIAGRFTGIVAFEPLSSEAQQQILAKKAISLGAEYGLCVRRVAPEAARLLLPAEETTSIRGAICLLEARLAPIYQQAAGEGCGAYELTVRSGAVALAKAGAAATG